MRREKRGAKIEYIPYLRCDGRVCSKCKLARPASDFFACTRASGAKLYRWTCHSCDKERRRAYSSRPEVAAMLRARKREFLDRNPGFYKACYAKRKRENPERLYAKKAEYYKRWYSSICRDKAKKFKLLTTSPRYRATTALWTFKPLDKTILDSSEKRSKITSLILANEHFLREIRDRGAQFRILWLTTASAPQEAILAFDECAKVFNRIARGIRARSIEKTESTFKAIIRRMRRGYLYYTLDNQLVTPDFLQKKAQEMGEFLGKKLDVFYCALGE